MCFGLQGIVAEMGLSMVVVLLQAREPSVLTECVPEVLRQFVTPERGQEERYGVIATSGQLTKGEVRCYRVVSLEKL